MRALTGSVGSPSRSRVRPLDRVTGVSERALVCRNFCADASAASTIQGTLKTSVIYRVYDSFTLQERSRVALRHAAWLTLPALSGPLSREVAPFPAGAVRGRSAKDAIRAGLTIKSNESLPGKNLPPSILRSYEHP